MAKPTAARAGTPWNWVTAGLPRRARNSLASAAVSKVIVQERVFLFWPLKNTLNVGARSRLCARPFHAHVALARQGDAEAASILAWNARSVGQVAANLADLLFPEVILLGSMARHLGDSWVGTVRAKFLEEAHPHARNCKIEPASLGERLQDLSALVVALH